MSRGLGLLVVSSLLIGSCSTPTAGDGGDGAFRNERPFRNDRSATHGFVLKRRHRPSTRPGVAAEALWTPVFGVD
jgi:hypothetical protein